MDYSVGVINNACNYKKNAIQEIWVELLVSNIIQNLILDIDLLFRLLSGFLFEEVNNHQQVPQDLTVVYRQKLQEILMNCYHLYILNSYGPFYT